MGDTAATEAVLRPELTKAKQTIKELRDELDEAEMRITDAEARKIAAEQRFGAAGDLFARLFASRAFEDTDRGAIVTDTRYSGNPEPATQSVTTPRNGLKTAF